jgi:hypothetical protein
MSDVPHELFSYLQTSSWWHLVVPAWKAGHIDCIGHVCTLAAPYFELVHLQAPKTPALGALQSFQIAAMQ